MFLPRLRSVRPFEVAKAIARAVELSPDRASLAVRTAWYPAEAPSTVPFIDADAWLATALGLLPAFGMTVPSLREVRRRAARSMLVATLARTNNNLSEASRRLDHSRKVVRDVLRREGLYPIPDIARGILTTNAASKSGNVATIYAGATLAGLRILIPRAEEDDRPVLEGAAAVVERMGRGEKRDPGRGKV